MRHTAKSSVIKPLSLLLFAVVFIMAGCSLQKESGFNRSMQNLTAHYNILFNANELLRLKQASYSAAFVDNYNEVLSVYQDTTAKSNTADKDLDAAIIKANTIINFKEQSHYIGDAYLLLGKANYLAGNYFDAVEYFTYVLRSFPKRNDLVEEAQVWKARTLIYLDQVPLAKLVIDSAIQNINPKKRVLADIYATKLEYDIVVADYTDGEEMAKLAVKYCREKNQRMRWTFILAQIEEVNKDYSEAVKNYSQIAKSNALFEMAFNASLNLITIQDIESGSTANRINKLLALLKNPNNKEFKDQIYYKVAQIKYSDKKIDDAIKDYNLSLRASVKNQSQKGLSYLRLAEIYFSDKTDYIRAKKYYDSTLTSLPTNFPGYAAIKKKGDNLALLADRLQIIAREDTLQALARMDEKTRAAVIDKMVSDNTLQQQALANAAMANAASAASASPSGSYSGGSFYFDNANAVSQGFTDFKKQWGNRKLEDDWRRSTRAVSDVTNNTSNAAQTIDPDAPAGKGANAKTSSTASAFRKQLLDGLPLTPELLAASNQRVYNAYVDIGNFYRDVLEDSKEAIVIFELILHRFPDDPNKPAIYYSLYRLYGDVDPVKADLYKNKLLKEFPETPFAKIISDPEFAKRLEDQDAEFTRAYNAVFDLYAARKYKEVIAEVPNLLKQYPKNKLSAQIYYLQTVAQGHFERAGPFTDSLKNLIKYYPNDKLMVPLAQQHLAFINAHQTEMMARDVVIADDDPHEVPFTLAQELQKKASYRKTIKPLSPEELRQLTKNNKAKLPEVKTAKIVKPDSTVAAATPNKTIPPANIAAAITQPKNQTLLTSQTDSAISKVKVNMPSIFSKLDSTNYYFVINVTTGRTNLASSRFGIGQFNRANYAGNGIRHQLLAIGDSDQVIYVGRFTSLASVKKYAHDIAPLLPDIMKVPKDKYSYFIITKENLDKLADQKTLDSYIYYYQNNF